MTDTVYKNNNYKVIVGEGVREFPEEDVYLVVNIATDVVEAEVDSLPRAMSRCDQLDVLLMHYNPELHRKAALIVNGYITDEESNAYASVPHVS